MKKKIQLPESHADITLDKFIKYTELKQRENMTNREFNKRKVMIFVDIDYRDVEKLEVEGYLEILQWVDEAMETDAPFQKFFEIDGVKYGMNPNLNEMQAKEFFDLQMYGDKDENLHRIMAILYRPVTGTDAFGNYQIEPYKGTGHHAEKMRKLPMSIVFGAIFFFRNLRTELTNHVLLYSEVVARQREAEQKSSSKSGGGIRQLINWLKGNRGNMSTSKT